MMALVPMLAEHLGVKDQELLEKDVRLHALLASLIRDPTFGPHLVFKGGTCITKCYLDYPRFSTDSGFTWVAGAGAEGGGHGTRWFHRRIRPPRARWKRGSRIGPSAKGTGRRTPNSSAMVGATA